MFRLVVVVVSFLLLSCKNRSDSPFTIPGTNIKELLLDHFCAKLKIPLPENMDTLIRWKQFTDYAGGARYDYRFKPKVLPVFRESGFFYNVLADSVNQVTIRHLVFLDPSPGKGSPLPDLRNVLKESIFAGGTEIFTIDTSFQVSGFPAAAAGYERADFDNTFFEQNLAAVVLVGGNVIEIQFENRWKYVNKYRKDFLSQSLKMLLNLSVDTCR